MAGGSVLNGKKLVLVGGGHAHMETLANLKMFREAGIDVTVIQPLPYHYYSGMGPGVLGGTYEPEEIRFHTKVQVEKAGCRFILDAAVSVDPRNQRVYLKDSDVEIPYDVISLNTGSQVEKKNVSDWEHVVGAKPIEQLVRARELICQKGSVGPLRVAVVGGGPSAVEIAGNVRQLSTCAGLANVEITIYCGSELLSGRPLRVQKLARGMLESKKILIKTSHRVEKVSAATLFFSGGTEVATDLVFLCSGVNPSQIALHSGLPTGPDGGMLVNSNLQSVAYDTVFGGGDCIDFEPCRLDKVGVYAVRQNPILLHNLFAKLTGSSLQQFRPGGKYLLIYNLGGGQGLFFRRPFLYGGRLPFLLKDWIDRRFIRRFKKR